MGGRYKIELTVSRDIGADNLADYAIDIVNLIFLKVRIQSRHINKTRYHVYIVAERNGEGKDSVKEYCTCTNGARTVGCCTHIMSIIWYLGYAKYLSHDIQISEHSNNIFVMLNSSDDEPSNE